MTDKEKAIQMFEKYLRYVSWNDNYTIMSRAAKECCYIAIDEVIDYAKTFKDVAETDIDNLNQIKREIERL